MAANNIGEVSVSFVAEFARFREDMTKVGKGVKDATSEMAASFKSVNSAIEEATAGLGALGLAFGLGEIVSFIKEAITAVGELKSLALQTGLSTDALQTWQFAARESGTGAEQMTAGIEALTRRIGEAAAGNDAAIKTFKELGVGVLDAGNRTRSTEDIMMQLAHAVAAAKTPADQARIAFEAFGKSGQALIPTLLEMSKGYDEVHQKADDLWQISTPAAIEAADGLGADITILKNGFITLAGTIAQIVKPVFDDIIATINTISGAIKYFQDSVGHLAYSIGSTVRGAVGLAPIDPSGGNEALLSGLGGSFGLGKASDAGQHNPEGANAAASAAQKQAEAIKKVVDGLALEYANLGKDSEQQKINTALRQANVTASSAAGQQITGMIHNGEEYRNVLADLNDEEKRRDDLMKEGRDVLASLETPLEKLFDSEDRLDQLLAGGAITLDEYNESLKRMKANYAASDPEVKKAAEVAKQYQDTLVGLAESLGTDLVRAFTDAGSASDRFKNLAVHALQDVLNAVTKLITASITGGSGGTTGGLGSIFGSIAASLFGGSAVLGPLAGSPVAAFAEGGDAGAGQMAIVGEHGPELVQFGAAAHVFPSGTGIRQAGGTTYNIDARGADQAAIARLEATLRELHRSIEPRAVAAVNSERKRGGSFAAAFAR